MDGNKKVTFTLSIGYPGAKHKETFTLDELGYDKDVDGELEDYLEKEWHEWASNYIDGSWVIED